MCAIHDAPDGLKDAHVAARLLDRRLKPVLQETWTVNIPGGGRKSDDREIAWPIPADTPESYFFLELTLSDSTNRQLSRQAYPLRVLKSLADPEKRKKWQSKPVAEELCTKGPWLRPQLAAVPTTLTARLIAAREISSDEAELSVEIRNTGSTPAYPVQLGLLPDVYSVLWSDNYCWLAPGQCVTVVGTVRLNMTGLDPVSNPPRAKLSDLNVNVSRPGTHHWSV